MSQTAAWSSSGRVSAAIAYHRSPGRARRRGRGGRASSPGATERARRVSASISARDRAWCSGAQLLQASASTRTPHGLVHPVGYLLGVDDRLRAPEKSWRSSPSGSVSAGRPAEMRDRAAGRVGTRRRLLRAEAGCADPSQTTQALAGRRAGAARIAEGPGAGVSVSGVVTGVPPAATTSRHPVIAPPAPGAAIGRMAGVEVPITCAVTRSLFAPDQGDGSASARLRLREEHLRETGPALVGLNRRVQRPRRPDRYGEGVTFEGRQRWSESTASP
jgi:hypothetical protein